MATLFGRNRKHRSRTTSAGSDALEQSSVPYASTSTAAMPPIPRHSISSDGPGSRASDVSMSSGMVSPTLRDITPPMNLIPEHRPYENGTHYAAHTPLSRSSQQSSTSRKRSETPDLSGQQQARRRPSQATDPDSSYYAASTHTSSSSGRPPARQMDRLTQVLQDGTHRQSSATSSSRVTGSDGFTRTNSHSSSHARHSETSDGRRGSSTQHARDRTPSTHSRNEQLIPPYSPTMRSIGNTSSQFVPYPYNATPSSTSQASQQAAMRASQASTHSVKSHRSSISLNSNRTGPPPTPPIHASEFVFPRPSSDDDIEGLFEDLLQRTDVPVRDRDGMRHWPLAKKWTMIYNDKLQDWKQRRKSMQIERTTPQLQGTPAMSATPMVEQTAILNASQADPNNKMRLQRGKTESPEWYLTKFMDGSIQPAIVSSLTVGLRTYEISWVETFVNKLHGLSVLTSALANISKLPVPRKEHDIKLELEIVKCLKHLLQMQVRRIARHFSWYMY